MIYALVDMPDIGDFLHMCLDLVLYPWTNWTFNLLGVFHVPAYWFLIGCFIFGLVLHCVQWLSNDPKALFFGFIGGGGD